MINTRMNVKEVINEFQKDWTELIRSRFFGYISANKKAIRMSQKQKEKKEGKEVWIKCSGVRRISTPRNNKYRAILKARFNGEKPGFMSTTYLILTDSNTGAKVVYLLPASKDDKGLIMMTPRFFNEFAEKMKVESECFEDLVDSFMKTDKYFTLYQGNQGDPKYNCQVDMGSGMVGFGTFSEEDATFKVIRFYTLQEIEKIKEEKKIDSKDPLTIFLASRRPEEKTEEDQEKEKTDRQREIDAAWAEYENLKYYETNREPEESYQDSLEDY